MVSVLVVTVAPFRWRHNARRTALEWLERSSMRFKRPTCKVGGGVKSGVQDLPEPARNPRQTEQRKRGKQRSRLPFPGIQTELRCVRGETLAPTLELYLYNSAAVIRRRAVFRKCPLPNRVIRSHAPFAFSNRTSASDPSRWKFRDHCSVSGDL
jgi:hypothetical protein